MMWRSIFASLFVFSCASANGSHDVEIAPNKVVKLTHFPQSEQREFRDPSPEAEQDYSQGIQNVEVLGMAGVPVLDQGQHGTCVTFSSTAALDALLVQGDFISQQCSLELDRGLGKFYWNGASYPSEIIDPLKQHGVVSKVKCPRAYPNPFYMLSPAEYAKHIDAGASLVMKNVSLSYFASPSLDDVKNAIDSGHRVLTGFLVDSSSSEAVRGFDLTVDGVAYSGGLWACQQGSSANHCVPSNAGHEVVITGYDDDQQLFKIRNSWGVVVGQQGDYYMTYKFWQSMAIDATEVW